MQAYADICNRPPSVYGLYLPYTREDKGDSEGIPHTHPIP